MKSYDSTIEKFEVGNLTVRIEPDPEPSNPREDDNLGTMICWHRRYNLGDGVRNGKRTEPLCDPSEFNPDEHKVCLPLYLYDHSGLRMKVGSFQGLLPQGHAEFDSGQVGWIYCDAEKIRTEYSVKRIGKRTLKKVEDVLRGEVETYDQYLSGQVYGFIVEDAEGNQLDSLWGFFGDIEDCKAEGKSAAEGWLKENEKADKLGLEANQ